MLEHALQLQLAVRAGWRLGLLELERGVPPARTSVPTWLSNHGSSCTYRQRTDGGGPARCGPAAARPRSLRATRPCASSAAPSGRAGCGTASRPPGRRASACPCRAGRRPRPGRRGGRRPRARRSSPAARRGGPCRPRGCGGTIDSKESPNAAQCSRSAAWRIFSPTHAAKRPQAPSQTASFHASTWCSAGVRNIGSEVPSSRWSTPPVACSSIQRISRGSTMLRTPGSSTRPARESSITTRAVPMSR